MLQEPLLPVKPQTEVVQGEETWGSGFPFPTRVSAQFVGYPLPWTPAAALGAAVGTQAWCQPWNTCHCHCQGLDLALGVPGNSWPWWPLEVGCLCCPEWVWLTEGVPGPHEGSAQPWETLQSGLLVLQL